LPGSPARAPSHAPAELAIEDAVADIMDLMVETRCIPTVR